MNAVAHAIEKAGSLTALARLAGVKPPTVCGWRDRGIVPADRVIVVSKATGIPHHILNPAFPPSSEAA